MCFVLLNELNETSMNSRRRVVATGYSDADLTRRVEALVQQEGEETSVTRARFGP